MLLLKEPCFLTSACLGAQKKVISLSLEGVQGITIKLELFMQDALYHERANQWLTHVAMMT